MNYPVGATSVSIDVLWLDDAGLPVTGKVAADFSACKWSSGTNTADTTITLSDLSLITTAHPNDNTAGGVKEREGGVYRLDLPNNMFTAAGHKAVIFAYAAGKNIFPLSPVDVQYLQVNVIQVNGTAQTARDIGASVLLSSGTGTGQISLTAGLVTLAGVTHTGAVIPTVTTTTNLTNAPTSGDLTSTMKTSVTTAATAATPTVTLPAMPTDWVSATGVSSAAVTKIQAGLATPTNITAGVITTVTNLTNLPAISTDWLSAAGVSAAAVTKIQSGLSTYAGGAVASVTGNVGGNLLGSLTADERNAVADAHLVRDWTAVAGTVATRSTLNALRFLRNKWTLSGTTLTVFDEVGGTAWTSTVTATAGADPVTATNPS